MFEIEFEGLRELMKIVEELASESQIEKTNKKVLVKCGDLAHDTAQTLIHKSKDNSSSGRKGSRPQGHASDNIPKPKLKSKYGQQYIIVGWEKSDNSPYFYMKFEEWGTSQRAPHHSFGLVNKMLMSDYDEIAAEEFNGLVEMLER